MTADAHLSHTVHNLPAEMLFCGFTGALRPHVKHYADQGVVRVIAGPETAHVVIDIQRPYFRPETLLRIARAKGGDA